MKETLNKYIHVVENNDEFILYNTINEAIVSIPKRQIAGRSVEVSKDEYVQLRNMRYFETESESLKYLLSERRRLRDTLTVTISLTQACNIKCTYCCQNDSKDTGIISEETLDYTVRYIVMCVGKYRFKKIAIEFFGGEPLLAEDRILYFKKQLEKVMPPDQISYAIATNGVLLSHSFYKQFNQLFLNVTLSDKRDHDTKRIFADGAGTFDCIMNNLASCSELFNDRRQLRIRNNVSLETMDTFEDFVRFIKNSFPCVKYMEVVPITDFSYNSYRANMVFEQFSTWYINCAIDILLANNIAIPFPSPIYSHCHAYAPCDIKVFHDGALGVCNGQKYSTRVSNMKDIEDVSVVTNLFETKHISPLDDECLICPNVFLCGGKQFCKIGNPCNYLHYSLDDFLKKYCSYVGTEKEILFSHLSK